MSKKKILITGAMGGIGQKLCQSFQNEGWFVAGMDVRAKDDIPHCDISYDTDIHKLCTNDQYREEQLNKISSEIGDLFVLINNAAVQLLDNTEDLKLKDWNETLNVNLTGPLMLIQYFLPILERTNGSVINIASIHQQLTKPKFVSYATSKSALVGLTKALAVDLQGRIRINCISPAAVETEMLKAGFNYDESVIDELKKLHPMQRIGSPEEVAKCALFLTSNEVKFLNGANLQLDGGISSVLNDLRD